LLWMLRLRRRFGDTVWRDRKARLFGLHHAKKRVMTSRDAWEENHADFEACNGMPRKGTKEYN
jgi:hypothetical protein